MSLSRLDQKHQVEACCHLLTPLIRDLTNLGIISRQSFSKPTEAWLRSLKSKSAQAFHCVVLQRLTIPLLIQH